MVMFYSVDLQQKQKRQNTTILYNTRKTAEKMLEKMLPMRRTVLGKSL